VDMIKKGLMSSFWPYNKQMISWTSKTRRLFLSSTKYVMSWVSAKARMCWQLTVFCWKNRLKA